VSESEAPGENRGPTRAPRCSRPANTEPSPSACATAKGHPDPRRQRCRV